MTAMRGWTTGFGVLLVLGASCTADLETSCVDGECTSGIPNVGQLGGAGGAFVCNHDKTFDLPCEVYDTLSVICQNCHFKDNVPAVPFGLESFADTQADYFGTVVWERMERATKLSDPPPLPSMPLGSYPLPPERLDYLTAWFETCKAGACAKGQGINEGGATASGGASGTGAAGAGGAGGTGGAGGI